MRSARSGGCWRSIRPTASPIRTSRRSRCGRRWRRRREPSAPRQAAARRRDTRARRSTSDPALADAYTTLGVVLSTSGRKAEAIDELEARRRARRRAVQRALQPLVRARRRRPPRRGRRLRPPVRRHRAARVLRPRHPAHPRYLGGMTSGLTPAPGRRRDCRRLRPRAPRLGSDPSCDGVFLRIVYLSRSYTRLTLRLVLLKQLCPLDCKGSRKCTQAAH